MADDEAADRALDREPGQENLAAVSEPAVSVTASVVIAVSNPQNCQNGAKFPSCDACPICLISMQQRIDGRFRVHGPIRDRCPCSGSLPAKVSNTSPAVPEEAVPVPLNERSSTLDLHF